MKSEDLKEGVKEKYGAIANQSLQMAPLSCCGSSGCCGENGFSMIGDEYQHVKGDIEEMPFTDSTFDVIVSNCVLNLVPDKNKAFSEMMRVLKPSGHFCVSDVVLKGDLPEAMKHDVVLYTGCVSGAIALDDYLSIIAMQGFHNITLHKQKEILIPEEITDQYLSAAEPARLKNGDVGIYSITVSGFKH